MIGLGGVRYTPNRAGVERLLRSPDGPTGQHLARLLQTAQNAARRRANVDTGNMRSRIEFTVEVRGGVLTGVLAARTSYARFVHDGTRRYRGNPFLTDAVRETLR